MFKWLPDSENTETDNNEKEALENIIDNHSSKPVEEISVYGNMNTILKGSKLTGNINVTCDLELSGDVEGNITSEQNSSIVIKGTCKGNIVTKEGNVHIDGDMKSGNIKAGGYVKITGNFNGGEVKAKGRIYLNGEFGGKLEGNEIEIGSNARGKGELHYREYITLAKGAKVDVQINQVPQEFKLIKNPPETKAKNTVSSKKKASGGS